MSFIQHHAQHHRPKVNVNITVEKPKSKHHKCACGKCKFCIPVIPHCATLVPFCPPIIPLLQAAAQTGLGSNVIQVTGANLCLGTKVTFMQLGIMAQSTLFVDSTGGQGLAVIPIGVQPGPVNVTLSSLRSGAQGNTITFNYTPCTVASSAMVFTA